MAEIDNTEYEMFKSQAMSNPDMMAQMQAMPPEERENYIRNLFRDYQGEEELLNEQVARSDMMRSADGPEGRYTGSTYVAADPLEHVAAGIRGYKGEQGYRDAMQGKADISADKSSAQQTTGNLAYGAMGDLQGGTEKVNNANSDLYAQVEKAKAMRLMERMQSQ